MSNLKELKENPQQLGPNYQTVLNFWKFAESLTDEQKEIIKKNHDGNWRKYNKKISLEDTAYAVTKLSWAEIVDAFDPYSINDTFAFAAAWATFEIIGMHILVEKGYQFHYLKKFEAVQELAQAPSI